VIFVIRMMIMIKREAIKEHLSDGMAIFKFLTAFAAHN
jgi:hypothetical protein